MGHECSTGRYVLSLSIALCLHGLLSSVAAGTPAADSQAASGSQNLCSRLGLRGLGGRQEKVLNMENPPDRQQWLCLSFLRGSKCWLSPGRFRATTARGWSSCVVVVAREVFHCPRVRELSPLGCSGVCGGLIARPGAGMSQEKTAALVPDFSSCCFVLTDFFAFNSFALFSLSSRFHPPWTMLLLLYL